MRSSEASQAEMAEELASSSKRMQDLTAGKEAEVGMLTTEVRALEELAAELYV